MVLDMENKAVKMIEEQIRRARGSKGYFPREQFEEAHGMNEMAYNLEAITLEQYLEYNHQIVALGINNPEYFK
jgi:hypothetical protein